MDSDRDSHIKRQLQHPQEHDATQPHDDAIRWSAINTGRSNTTPQPPKLTEKAAAKARPKTSKKRASDTTQRRLPGPRLAKIVPVGEDSEAEQQLPPRKRRRTSLPKAARNEDQVPHVKQEAFSPLRKSKWTAPRYSPVVPSSPPQVIITPDEVEAATQAQALEVHIEKLQERLSLAQTRLQSPAKEQASQDTLNTVAGAKNPLSQLQQQSSAWFSNIDEAMAEVAVVTGAERPHDGETDVQQEIDANARVSGGPDSDQHNMVEDAPDEMDISDTWPAHLVPEQHEIAERIKQRKLTVDDLEMEELFEDPQGAWESRENARRAARNILREHIVRWSLERTVYKGLAKYVQDSDGETTVAYAKEGETFPVPKYPKAAKREDKATKKFISSSREAIHSSLAISELEAEMLARQPAVDDIMSVRERSDVEVTEREEDISVDESEVEQGRKADGEDADDNETEAEEIVAGEDAEEDEMEKEEELAQAHAEDQEFESEPGAEFDATADASADAEILGWEATEEEAEEEAEEEVEEEVVEEVDHAAEEQEEAMRTAEEALQEGAEIAETEEQVEADEREEARVEKKSRRTCTKPQTRDDGEEPTNPLTRQQRKVQRRMPAPSPVCATTQIERAPPAAQDVIPTPPESHQTQQGQSLAPHPAIVQVEDWLASQDEEPPLPPDDLVVESTSRKRKHKVGKAEIDLTQSKAKKRKMKGSESAKPKRRVTMSGPFTQEEKETADEIFGKVLEREGLHEADLIAQIKNWKMCCVRFKTAMFDAFSDRTADSIRKFCQRRWHGYQRGAWTQEEDDALRAAHASQPGKWAVISDRVGRSGQDCKDRWRNHFEFGPKTVGPWTEEEEQQLMTVVEQCIDMIKEEKSEDVALVQDRERLVALVNWSVVSEKLHGARYPARCREKYANMTAHGSKKTNKRKSSNVSAEQETEGDYEARHVAAARRVVDGFEIGDYYDVFVEIHSSFEDPHQHFRHDKQVTWSIVSTKNMYSRFALYYKPSCLRRVALEKAIATWPANNAKIKRKLERVDTMPAKALVLAQWVEKTNAGRLDTMTRTYKPELIGKSKEELMEMKQARKKKFSQGPRGHNVRSKDYVTESEDGDDEPANTNGLHIPSVLPNEGEPTTEDEDVKMGDQEEELSDASGNEEDDDPSDITQDVPASQFMPSQTAVQQDDDMLMADVESLNGTPNISPTDFVSRLKSSGSSRRKSVGYGKKDALKGRRKSRR
jgi:hypothetical protein